MGDARVDAIFETLIAVARQDFTARAAVSDQLDTIDAIASGINMMAEELAGEVVSRRKLEAAYDSLRETQAKLVHSGKLAAIGQLASGVIHEVNNPASWSALALDCALRKLDEVSASPAFPRDVIGSELAEARDHLVRASEGVKRILSIVTDLRTFARAGGEVDELVLLDEVARVTCTLVQPVVSEHATLVLVEGGVPAVRAGSGRLSQVVTNLVINAAEAIAQTSRKGRVELATRSEGEHVILTVEDSGPGVPEHLRAKVFDPFFTTNPQGLGLGLSLVAEIVNRYGGDVTITDSELGGAAFRVRLPIARA